MHNAPILSHYFLAGFETDKNAGRNNHGDDEGFKSSVVANALAKPLHRAGNVGSAAVRLKQKVDVGGGCVLHH